MATTAWIGTTFLRTPREEWTEFEQQPQLRGFTSQTKALAWAKGGAGAVETFNSAGLRVFEAKGGLVRRSITPVVLE